MKIDPVEIWLSKLEKRHSGSDNTAQAYRRNLQRFCSFIGKNPVQIVEGWKDVKYDLKSREYYIDEMLEKVDVFENQLGKQGLCKNSVSSYLSSLQSFFKYMRIPVKIETFTARPVYHNRDITKEEIKRILNNSTPRDTAFYLMMLQSGLRPMTLLQLTYEQIRRDFEDERIPCHIDVPHSISKGEYTDHFTFMGPDAIDGLKAYFKERGMPKRNQTIFVGPKTTSAYSMRFGYYVRTLGLIKPENMRPGRKPQELRLYCLRNYFRNTARPAGADYVNFWMGHKTSYEAPHIPESDDSYFSRDIGHHRKIYEQKAMPLLRIFKFSVLETEQGMMELRRQLTDRDKEVAELRQQIEALSGVKRLAEVLERSKSLEEAFVRFKRLKDKEFDTN